MKIRSLETTTTLATFAAMTLAIGCTNEQPTTATFEATSLAQSRSPKPAAVAMAADAGAAIPAKYAAFAAAFDLERQSYGVPGAAVALIEHGQVTFTHGFGTAGPNSSQPVDADTIFRVGTTTEVMTAAAELSLIDRGKASLGEGIASLVPGVALAGPDAQSLTTRDLMSAQSGLFDFTTLGVDPALVALSCATDASTLHSFVTGTVFGQNESFMNPPGLFYTPSNPNFILTGAAIEEESGAFFPAAMKDVLFAPLGMTRTFLVPSDVESAGNYSDGLSTNPDGSPWDVGPGAYDCAAYRPYAYGFTTAADYAKLVQLLLVGDPKVLSDASRVAMESAQVSTEALGDVVSQGYGLTVQTGYVSPANAYYPTKTVSSIGAIPGFTSEIHFFPETGFGFVVLSNADGPSYDDALDVAVQSFAELPPAAPLPPGTNAVPARFPSYAGTYVDPTGNLGTIVVSDEGGALTVAFPEASTLGFTTWPQLSPVFKDTFLFAFEGYASPLSFIPDASGNYDHLLLLDLIPATRVPAGAAVERLAKAPSVTRLTDGATRDLSMRATRSMRPTLGTHARSRAAEATTALGTWHALTNPIPAQVAAGTALLLTDGTVVVQDASSPDWWQLTPDAFGSYVDGTWSELPPMPNGYAPTDFASAVLPDGRLVVEGGEYQGAGADEVRAESLLGAIYDPVADEWTSVSPPASWSCIGDASSVVLPDGRFLLATCWGTADAVLDASALTWAPFSSGKGDNGHEEGWTLLQNGNVLTVDTLDFADLRATEVLDTRTARWSSAGNTPAQLTSLSLMDPSGGHEMGPQVLRPDGTVWAVGGAGKTAVYHPNGEWTAGPALPYVPGQGQLSVADGPGTLLPNGHVMIVSSPGEGATPIHVFDFDGEQLTEVAGPPQAPNDTSFMTSFVILPTGEILFTDESNDVEIFRSSGEPLRSAAPVIADTALLAIHPGQTYPISGRQLNGLSQGSMYGDDNQTASNYPLVRITNLETKHVSYARTHDHSTMAVSPGNAGQTLFDVGPAQELGPSSLEVVANGIASSPIVVLVVAKP